MGKHHHHPHEGHGDGSREQHSKSKPIHHDWRFYAAGLCIFIALVIYLMSGDLVFQPHAPAPSPATLNGGK
jgi:hypothetical protein